MPEDELRADLKTILSMLADGSRRFNEADEKRKEMDAKLDAFNTILTGHMVDELSSLHDFAPTKVDKMFKGGVVAIAVCMTMLVGWNFSQDKTIGALHVDVNTVQNRIESVVEMQQVTINTLSHIRNAK